MLALRKPRGKQVLMRLSIKLLAAVVGAIALPELAKAQTPAAVVEDVQGKVTGAEFMDYVAPGKVIELGPAAMVVLGYMRSCWRETITGIGTVIVGAEESKVHSGEVKGNKVKCDAGHSHQIDRETGDSAATSFRGVEAISSVSPRLTLYGLSPLFETGARGKLMVERLDVKGERYDINLASARLLRRKFYDFARNGTSLKPGGTYAASLGPNRTVFVIDRLAEPGPTPIIGRLVRLQ
jgi:hypothetical protein